MGFPPGILILGERRDPHIRKVCSFLRQRNAQHIVIDPFESVLVPGLRLGHAAPATAPEYYSAIWDRMKPIGIEAMDERTQYVIRERQAAIRSLQLLHEGKARLMNGLLATERARSKLFQLQVAANSGFRIPRTYAGNNQHEILEFIEGCTAGAVAKSATWFSGSRGRFSFTRLVTRKTLTASRAAVAYSPLIYQEYVRKAFELRVMCIGSDIFAAKILSQQNSEAVVDWRLRQFDLQYEQARLPSDVRRKILKVQSALLLNFGALDLIVTPEGEHVSWK